MDVLFARRRHGVVNDAPRDIDKGERGSVGLQRRIATSWPEIRIVWRGDQGFVALMPATSARTRTPTLALFNGLGVTRGPGDHDRDAPV